MWPEISVHVKTRKHIFDVGEVKTNSTSKAILEDVEAILHLIEEIIRTGIRLKWGH